MFYTDSHISKRGVNQLRSNGIPIIHCEEVGMADAGDDEHLEYATEHSMLVVTQDDDFTRLDAEWRSEGRPHSGIMFVPNHLRGTAQISLVVRELTTYYTLIMDDPDAIEEFRNTVTFL